MILLVAESVLLSAFGVESFGLQSGVGVTIYLGLRREFVTGALTLAALLPVVEWLVSGPMGFYSLGLVVVFFVLRALRGNIQKRWGFAQMILAALMAFLHAGVMVIALLLANANSAIMHSVLWNVWMACVLVGLTFVPLARFLERGDRMLNPRSGRTVLEVS
ncbi:MAG: hypothetical protein H0U74_05705 [Bradymonadaceae bacterium]|nr:hypothetical protein [Lujinxingiaceae bacterium]